MPEIEIPMNVEVRSSKGPYGRSRLMILDPVADKVTHLVIEENDLSMSQRLVPLKFVGATTPERIELTCSPEELGAMEIFVEQEFIPAGGPMSDTMLWPYVAPGLDMLTIRHEKLPPGEVKVRRGTDVHATDGRIGKVDELMVDQASGGITHLILVEGHLWGRKDISIPVDKIERIEPGAIHLKLSKKEVEALPTIPVHRPHRQ